MAASTALTAGDTAASIASAYPLMSSYADEIVRVSNRLGIHPSWLANVINFESSGGDPSARNWRSSATGLIQFIPPTAKSLGTTVDALRSMSGREQMAYVEKYFSKYAGKLRSQEDVYMAVFYPRAIGNPDYPFPLSVVASNPGIYTPRDYVNMANRAAKLTPYVGAFLASGLSRAYGMWPLLLILGAGGITAALIWRKRFGSGSR